MKKFIKLGVLALGVFLLAGCGAPAAPAPVSMPAPSLLPWATKFCPVSKIQYFGLGPPSTLDDKFKGAAISDIAKNYLALSNSKADALGAITSEDGKELVVTYVSCDWVVGQNTDGLTQDETVIHLVVFTGSDAASGKTLVHLPAFSGSNFGALYLPVGFVDGSTDESHRVLVKGKIVDSGAGGSCATTYWMTVDADTAATTSFTTEPDALVYAKNTKIVYVHPNGCMSLPDSLRVKFLITGAEEVAKNFDGSTYASLKGITEQFVGAGQTQAVLTYFGLDTTKPLTLILP